MYARKKVSERLALAESRHHFTPRPHSLAEVDEFESRLRDGHKYILNDTGQPIGVHNLTPEERQWMLNEQILCACDASYALTRYIYLIDEEAHITRFSFRTAQAILFDIISDLEDRGYAIEIMVLKARQLGICLVPSTKVLTANLEWKSIEDIKVGEEVVACDENFKPGKGNERLMRTAMVRAKSERIHPTIELTLDNGRIITATPEHPFLCKLVPRTMALGVDWRKTGDIRVGDEIKSITSVWGEGDLDDAWLGGLIDGEGSLRQKERAGSELTIAQVAGPVLERARKILERYGPVREDIDRRLPGTTSKLGKQEVHKLVVGRMNTMFQILGRTRPTRFIGRRFWEGKGLPGKKIGNCWAKVLSVRPAGEQRVINLDTTTGTFIAEGVVSHNTSLIQPLIGLRLFFGYAVNAVAGSADRQKTALMATKMFLSYDMLPLWLRPKYTQRAQSEQGGKMVFGRSLCGVSFQHGAQMSGIARGHTPTVYHLSEVASFANANAQIEASLFKCVHPSASVFGVLESTGEGDEGWWAETWHSSKSNWATGRARLCPLFLPWFCGIDLYPKPMWMHQHPVPGDWLPNEATREHIARAQLYVQSHLILRKHLGARWSMPREQQWFWEVNHEEHKAKGEESLWYQEMAGDDVEALQRSSESVFGHDTIAMVEDNRDKSYEMYTMTGQSIEDSHELSPEFFDYTVERIPVVYSSSRGNSRWELIRMKQVKLDESRPEDADGVLLIWEHPQRNVNYAIGVDTSAGKGADSTVISVWAMGYETSPDVQVAEFSSAYVSHVESFAFVLCIAAYYAKFMNEGTTRWREPYVSIEQVEAVGDVAQHQMGILGYRNFHKMPRYDGTVRKIQRQKKSDAKTGWYTWGWSRPILIDTFVHWARAGWAKINSPWLIEEMRHFEVHPTGRGKDRLEHKSGKNDDRIFGAALGIFPPHDTDSMTARSKKRIEDPTALPPIDVGGYRGAHIVSPDQTRVPMSLEDIIYGDARELRKFNY